MAIGIRKPLIALFCGAVMLVSCRSNPQFDPDALYLQAETKFQHGDLNAAMAQVDDGLLKLGKDRADEAWRFRLLKAEILIWQGFSQDAITLLEAEPPKGAAMREVTVRRRILLGLAYSNLRQLDKAEREFADAEHMNETIAPEFRGEFLLGEGKLASFRHDSKKSESLIRQALKIANESGQPFLETNALGTMGMVQMQQHRYAEAVNWFNESLPIAQQLQAQTVAARTMANLGFAYLDMGDLDRAFDLFSQAESESRQLGLVASQETSLLSLGAICTLRKDYPGAERNYQLALALARQEKNNQRAALSLTNLAQIAIETKQYDLAEKYNSEALSINRSIQNHDTELYSLNYEALIAFGRQQDELSERLLREVIHDAGPNLTLKGQTYADLAKLEARRKNTKLAKQYFETSVSILEGVRVSLGREEFELSYPTNAKDVYDAYIDFLMNQGLSDEAFTVAEMSRAKILTAGLGLDRELTSKTFSMMQARAVAGRLGHVILSYWLGPEHSYLWLVEKNSSHVFILPGEDQIQPLIDRYRTRVTGPFDARAANDADGRKLYQILIGPLEQLIPANSQVTIVSDGALCGLNFETLLVESPKLHYWIEDVSITDASSILLLSSHRRSEGAHSPLKTLLLIGDPKLPSQFPVLTHAGEEVKLIGRRFGSNDETVLSGQSASPTAYFQAGPEGYAYIHFATHGTASRVSPLDSAIVLSEDGKSYNLYARDIAAKKLNARLVTISACDSAGSRIYSADGLVGLSWAFLRAGAHQVIAALWEVNDASTPKMMDALYSGIEAGEEPSVALRGAKLALLRSQSVYSRPYYWASFVLYEGN
jgi:CHAT domain-containing protein/tetratricopeptide (TPR) repeat protein